MKQILLIKNYLVAFLAIVVFGFTGVAQYTVNFEGTGETKTAYASATVTLSGIQWNMTEVLIGTTGSDWKNGARSARLRGYGTSSMTMLQNKANGIGNISFKYRRFGTSAQVNWKVEGSINDGADWIQIGQAFTAPASDVVQTFSETINIPGNVRVRIKRATETGTSDNQLNIDDIIITDYVATSSISNLNLSSTSIQTGQTLTVTWASVGVTAVKVLVQMPGSGEWEDIGITAPAAPGTLDIPVPTGASEGTYKLRIVDASNPLVFAESQSFTITDVHFAGLYPNYPSFPSNGETNVAIDLFKVFDWDNEGILVYRSLALIVEERVKAGTGSIKVYKTAGSVLVYTINVNSPAVTFNDNGVVIINIGANLLPNTGYYVTIDNGAIVDYASTPNSFDGNYVWAFTTGSNDSHMPIAGIRQPVNLNVSDDSPFMGNYVITGGVVTYERSNGFYIQDGVNPWSGIFIRNTAMLNSVQPGDVIILVGKVGSFENLTQIENVLYWQKTGALPIPGPVNSDLTFDKWNSEQWESMLVKVENIQFFAWVTPTNELTDKKIVVTNGAKHGVIGDLLYNGFVGEAGGLKVLNVGPEFDKIVGVMNNNQGQYNLAPRDANDIFTKVSNVALTRSSGVVVYPNPAVDELKVKNDGSVVKVEVLNLAGQVVETGNKSSVFGEDIVIPLARRETGIYIVKITTNTGEVKLSKIVKR